MLDARLAGADAGRELQEAVDRPQPDALLRPPLDALDPKALLALVNDTAPAQPGRAALWLRMLLSALVDADFLDTEAYFDPDHIGEVLSSVG